MCIRDSPLDVVDVLPILPVAPWAPAAAVCTVQARRPHPPGVGQLAGRVPRVALAILDCVVADHVGRTALAHRRVPSWA
eukprot:5913130-Alexandrium_andersonii.AAC.1